MPTSFPPRARRHRNEPLPMFTECGEPLSALSRAAPIKPAADPNTRIENYRRALAACIVITSIAIAAGVSQHALRLSEARACATAAATPASTASSVHASPATR